MRSLLARVRPVHSIPAAIAFATFFAGCGHDVTPPAGTADLAGKMIVDVTVNGPLNLSGGVTYVIVVDTCGNGVPYPNALNTGSFKAFSYAFFVGGTATFTAPVLEEYFIDPNANGTIAAVAIPGASTLENLNPDLDGTGTAFELTFTRAQLANPLQQAQPCPAGSTTVPTWIFNVFTAQGNTVVDSLGPGGPVDDAFPGITIDTTKLLAVPYNKGTITGPGSTPAAQLVRAEIRNYP